MTPESESAPAAPLPAAKLAWRAVQVRLRFVAVLLAAFLVVGNWESIRNRVETAVRRPFGGGRAADLAVSTDTEYFCPMDPGILSDWPGRCGACNMALVRRKKGEASPRPDGVLARMQFSPYRVQLAGLRTAVVEYRPLEREVTGVGQVVAGPSDAPTTARVKFFERDATMLAVGRPVTVSPDGRPPVAGRIDLVEPPAGSCVVKLDGAAKLEPGTRVVVKVRVPVSDLEPFAALPTNAPPVRPGELRQLYVCAEHPETPGLAAGRCPADRNVLEPVKLADNQRVGWWCPMHPGVTSDAAGAVCKACEGMVLVPRVVAYRPAGRVLAVPESAVIDTGTRTSAFIERMPGMFDAVEIVVGPRCGDEFPVVSGLVQGDRVATSGALLIDAETRLNPALAAAYFGATGKPAGATPPDRNVVAQKCPVTGKALGSMGAPVRVDLKGQIVWICCSGCEPALRKDPAKYLAKSAKPE